MNGNFDENTAVAEQTATAETTEKPAETKSAEAKPVAKKAKTIKKNIYMKLFAVQQNLKAHKGQHNDYGNYNYRSAEDILEAVKPLLAEQEAIILINDEIFNLNNQVNRESKGETTKEMPCNYIKATVRFVDCETGEEITASAYARECQHTGMSADQCTGCASSYARKYALNALLCIDNTADSDSNAVAEIEAKAKEAKQQATQNNASQGNKGKWGSTGNTQPAQTSQPQKKGWGSQKASAWGK